MAGTAVGANIQNLSQGRLCNYEIDLPPRSVQDSIATTLSRYDALIENYQRQIKLLEEAAQRLYKEWFVDLHFPGHENVKVTDGVPEGWEKKSVGECITKPIRAKQVPASEYLEQGNTPVIDQSKNFIAGYTNDRECIVENKEHLIVFGDHTRVLKFTTFPFAKGADGTQLILSADLKHMPQTLLYASLVNVDLSNYSYARHFKYLKEQIILMPTELVAKKYDEITRTMFEAMQTCREQITLLTESRDRLLPKLTSGEIEMEI